MRSNGCVARVRAKRKEAQGLVLFAARVSVIGLFGLGASAAAQSVASRPDPGVLPQGEPPVETAEEEPQGREQRMLRQTVFRDRSVQRALDGAESALRSGDVSQAVGQLQQVLDQPGDHFIWIESEHRLASARRRAVNLLSAANEKAREFYDWAHAGEAQRLLERGRAASDSERIRGSCAAFFPHRLGL